MSIVLDNLKIYSGLTLAILFGMIGLLFGGYFFLFLALITIVITCLGGQNALFFGIIGFMFWSFFSFVGVLGVSIWIGYAIFLKSPFSFWELLRDIIKKLSSKDSSL